MDVGTAALLIRIFAILGAGGFITYRFREIKDAESGGKAAAGILISLLFVLVMWIIAEPIAEALVEFGL